MLCLQQKFSVSTSLTYMNIFNSLKQNYANTFCITTEKSIVWSTAVSPQKADSFGSAQNS